MKKAILALAIAVGVFGLTGGAALAHECFNANRSAQGNTNAGKAPVWLALELHEIFWYLGLEDQEDREAAAAIAAANGVPTSVTVFIGPILIGHGSRAFEEMGHATDGKGIDHFDPLYDDLLIEALCEVDPANDLCSGP